MWLSQKIAREQKSGEQLQEAMISVGGESPGVLADAEVRSAVVVSPGGYEWRPSPMDRVFACRVGDTYVLGKLQESTALEAGQVRLRTGSASVTLCPDGRILLEGTVYVNGEKWEVTNEATFG